MSEQAEGNRPRDAGNRADAVGPTRRNILRYAGLLMFASCAETGSGLKRQQHDEIARIEHRIGGRIGVALVDVRGEARVLHRADERFAMCSTFKALLAAAVLERTARGGLSLAERLSVSERDLVPYAPVVKAHLDRGWMTVEQLCRAAVQLSDNVAANILLSRLGGPAALTAFCRRHGDELTRLDRTEPELNENAVADPRDTTTPLSIARLLSRLLYLENGKASRDKLRQWMAGSKTGKGRIRAGVPSSWIVGNKTGTGRRSAPMFCDVAFLESPRGRRYVLSTYCDRPSVTPPSAGSSIAEVTRVCLSDHRI